MLRKSKSTRCFSNILGEYRDEAGQPIALEDLQEDSTRRFHQGCVLLSKRIGDARPKRQKEPSASSSAQEPDETSDMADMEPEKVLDAASRPMSPRNHEGQGAVTTPALSAKTKTALFWKQQPVGPMRTTSRYVTLLPCFCANIVMFLANICLSALTHYSLSSTNTQIWHASGNGLNKRNLLSFLSPSEFPARTLALSSIKWLYFFT